MKKYRITVEGTVYDVEVEEIGAAGGIRELAAGGAAAPQPHPLSRQNSAAAGAGPAADRPAPAGRPEDIRPPQGPGSATAVKAPMPGTVLSVNVTEGQQVTAGETLLILEAMKMENEIPAPVSGRITSVTAVKGTQVNTGDMLVTLE